MLRAVPMVVRNKLVCSALHVVMSGTQRAQRCRHHENVITSLCTAMALPISNPFGILFFSGSGQIEIGQLLLWLISGAYLTGILWNNSATQHGIASRAVPVQYNVRTYT